MAKLSIVVLLTFEKNIPKNVTQGEDALKAILVVYNDYSMHTRLANGVENCVQAVIWRAGVNPRIILEDFEK
jgi:hypothetical protein